MLKKPQKDRIFILRWHERQDGYNYSKGFLGCFKKKTRKPNIHYELEIDEEKADFIVNNFPRHGGTSSYRMNKSDYSGSFYCAEMERMWIEIRFPQEVNEWIKRFLEK